MHVCVYIYIYIYMCADSAPGVVEGALQPAAGQYSIAQYSTV